MNISATTQNLGAIENGAISHAQNQGAPFSPTPRVWSVKQIAARFNRSIAWVYAHMPRLVQLGFPKKDEAFGGWDSLAIEGWFDRRSGVSNNTSIEDQMLEAIRGDC